MTQINSIVGAIILPFILLGSAKDDVWLKRFDSLEKHSKTNLIASAKNKDIQSVLYTYKEFSDLSTSAFRSKKEEDVIRLFRFQLLFFKTVSNMRDWRVDSTRFKPDYKKLPQLSKEAMDAIGIYRQDYNKIPDTIVREEVKKYMGSYNEMDERFKSERTLEKIHKDLEKSLKLMVESAKEINQTRLQLFVKYINEEIEDEDLRKEILKTTGDGLR